MPARARFGWFKVAFDDTEGENRGGLWYAPPKGVSVNCPAPSSEDEVKKVAKFGAVAIPLRYALGSKRGPSAKKYCVITNWWKERKSNGKYELASLDASLYKRNDNKDLVEEAFVEARYDSDGEAVPVAAV